MRTKSAPQKRVPAEIQAFLSAYDPNVQAIALQARALVLQIVPDAVEQIDLPAKMLAYGYQATYKDLICVISPQKTYVNLGFPHGTDLPDPAQLLVGTGKRARHVKLAEAKQVSAPELRALLEEGLADAKIRS
jgi:hypothetical protein